MARIFVSYARKTSASEADALSAALRGAGHEVFFDRTSIEDAAEFPRAIVDGLLDAQAFVALFDDAYARSWYCVRELRAALAARARAEQSDAVPQAPRIVIGLGRGVPQRALDGLPPDLRSRNWRWSSDIEGMAAMIGEALRDNASDPIRTWLHEHDEEVVELTSAARLPPPAPLPRRFPAEFPVSLGDRFYGRTAELWSIHLQLVVLPRSGAIPSTVLLQGFGGVGKSRLALEYVHRFGGRHFPGGVFWLDAGVPEVDFARQLHELVRALGATVGADDDPRRALVEWASRATEPILLVVDNLPADGAERAISHWCPLDGSASVLATARQRHAAWEKHVHTVEIGPLDEDAAAALLAGGLDREATAETSWRSLANALGGVPLALELLNTGMQLGAWQPHEVEARIERQGAITALDEAFATLRPHVSAGALRGIAAAFGASFDVLSPAAQRAADRLATLSPAPIPEAVVAQLADAATRVELVKHSIVQPVPREHEVPVFGQMHRLYAEFLNARAPAGRWARLLPERWQPRQRRVVSAIRDASEALAAVLETSKDSAATLFALVTHVEWVYALALRRQAGPDVSERLRSAYVEAILNFAHRHETHGEAFRALQATIRDAVADGSHEVLSSIELIDRTLSLQQPLVPGELELDFLILRDPTGKVPNAGIEGSNPDDPEVADALRRPMPRARELYELRSSMLGKTHLAALGIAAYTGFAAFALRDWELAREWLTIVYESCRSRYGERDPNTLIALWHLCCVLIFLDRDAQVGELLDRHLLWVLDEDLGSLEPRLRRLRANLCVFPDLTPEQLDRVMEAHDSPSKVAALRGLLSGSDRAVAIEHFSRAIDLGERRPDIFRLRYEAKLAIGDLDGAKRDLDAAREAGLETREYHSKAAAILIQQGARAGDTPLGRQAAAQALKELDAAIAGGSREPNDFLFRGMLRQVDGAHASAESDLRRALELGADPANVRPALAKALAAQERTSEAIAMLTALIEDGRPDDSAYLVRGKALFATGRFDAALADARAYLRVNPGSEEALVLEGRCLSELGDRKAARGRFDEALRGNRESSAALRQLLIAALEEGDFAVALELANRLLEQSPGEPILLLFKARSLRFLERYDEALQIALELTALTPDDAAAWAECGWSRFHLDQWEETVSDLRRSARFDPSNASVRRGIVACLMLLEREEEAMRELDAAVAAFPENHELRADRARELRGKERFDDAIADYQVALRSSGGDPSIALDLVDLLWKQNRYEDAVAALESVPGEKRDTDITLHLAVSLRVLQRHEEAKQQYGKVIAADPRHGGARYGRALVLRALERPYGALTDLDNAVRIDPDDADYRLERAEVLLDVGRSAEAVADLRHALAAAESPDLAAYGALFLRAGDFDAAAECLEKALAADADDAWARDLLAETLLFRGDLSRATALLENDAQDDAWTILLRALIYRAAGDPARCDIEVRKALEACDPDLLGRPLEPRELFNRALCLAVLGDRDGAREGYAATSSAASIQDTRIAAEDLQRAVPDAEECLAILTAALDSKLRPR